MNHHNMRTVSLLTYCQKHNVFMRMDVSFPSKRGTFAYSSDALQDPVIQKATGETEPVSVMAKLREMKNSFK